jgi:hypothetical protein
VLWRSLRGDETNSRCLTGSTVAALLRLCVRVHVSVLAFCHGMQEGLVGMLVSDCGGMRGQASSWLSLWWCTVCGRLSRCSSLHTGAALGATAAAASC